MVFRIAFQTHTGRVREHNEDNFTVNPDLRTPDWVGDHSQTYQASKAGTVLGVADGMGGVNAGEVASAIAIEAVQQYFNSMERPADVERLEKLTKNACLEAQKRIAEHEKANPETEGMGTTLVLAWILDDVAHISWVGDSRAYVFNAEGGLKPISKDHSLVQEWVDAGKLTDEQAFYHPQNNVITQSLGGGSRSIQPGYEAYPLRSGDILMLCSDGLNGMLLDSQMEAIIRQESCDLRICVETLVDAALDAGGHDNVTVVMASYPEANGALAPKAVGNFFPSWLIYVAGMLTAVVLGLLAYTFLNEDKEPNLTDAEKELIGEKLNSDTSSVAPAPEESAEEGSATPRESSSERRRRESSSSGVVPAPTETPKDELTPIQSEDQIRKDAANTLERLRRQQDSATGKWGFRNGRNEWIVQPEYDEVKDYREKRAAVKKAGKWGYVDERGAVVVAPKYEDAQDYNEDRAEVVLDGQKLSIDLKGNPIND
jgi:serine/threonine protein phosphatase PrpC